MVSFLADPRSCRQTALQPLLCVPALLELTLRPIGAIRRTIPLLSVLCDEIQLLYAAGVFTKSKHPLIHEHFEHHEGPEVMAPKIKPLPPHLDRVFSDGFVLATTVKQSTGL